MNNRFKSGDALLEMKKVGMEDSRLKFIFTITIKDDENYRFVGEDYSCPISWGEERIASSMFGWALDLTDEEDMTLYNAIQFNEYIRDEDVVYVKKLR